MLTPLGSNRAALDRRLTTLAHNTEHSLTLQEFIRSVRNPDDVATTQARPREQDVSTWIGRCEQDTIILVHSRHSYGRSITRCTSPCGLPVSSKTSSPM